MKAIFLPAALFILLFISCGTQKNMQKINMDTFSWQGHRGGRGLMPENTIAAMKKAIDVGANTMELDVVISADGKVVVSHDQYFNDLITTTPEGKYLTKKEGSEILLYKLPYDSIRKYDIGMKPYPDFPRQEKIRAYKPLLADLIDACEKYAAAKNVQVLYNIEIKSNERFDGIRHPDPKTYSELVMAVIRKKKIQDRVMIQSFDVRPLRYLHEHYPALALSYLVDKSAGSFEEQLDKLGFIPAIYSPQYQMVTKEIVQLAHGKGMKVIPWTANTTGDIRSLIEMGVDGVISDYPDLFSDLKNEVK